MLAAGSVLALLSCAWNLARTGRDALYVQQGGLASVPAAYLAIALLSVPMAFGMLDALRRFGPRRVRIAAPLAVASLLTVYAALGRPGGGPAMTLLFISVPLVFGVVFSATWLLVPDLLDDVGTGKLARAYAVTAASATFGGLVGGALSRVASSVVGPRGLLLSGAVAVAACAMAAAWAQRRFPSRLAAASEERTSGKMTGLFRERYPKLLLAVGMLAAMAALLVEFQIYVAAAAAGADARATTRVFANVYTLLNGVAFLVQLFVLPAVQRALGVHGSLLVLPAALLLGIALGGASMAARAGLRVLDGGLRASIYRVCWEQAYLPLQRTQRPAAKVLVDGAGARLAEGFAAALLLVWVQRGLDGGGPAVHGGWITAALGITIAVWGALALALGRVLRASRALEDASQLRFAVPLPDS